MFIKYGQQNIEKEKNKKVFVTQVALNPNPNKFRILLVSWTHY